MTTTFLAAAGFRPQNRALSTARLALSAALLATVFASRVHAQSAQTDTDVERCERPRHAVRCGAACANHMAALSAYQLAKPARFCAPSCRNPAALWWWTAAQAWRWRAPSGNWGATDQLQAGSNMGKGQMKAADYTLNPTVQFSDGNAGGVGGAIGGLIGRRFPMIGGMAGGLKFKSAETNIEIVDTRTTVQLVATQGKARRTSFSIGALAVLGLGGAVGAYGNTNEGKVIAASFVDNFNNIVRELRANSQLMAAGDVHHWRERTGGRGRRSVREWRRAGTKDSGGACAY